MKPAWYLEFMPAKKNIITLTDEERRQLESLARSTRRSPREKMRARILLLRDAGRALCPMQRSPGNYAVRR